MCKNPSLRKQKLSKFYALQKILGNNYISLPNNQYYPSQVEFELDSKISFFESNLLLLNFKLYRKNHWLWKRLSKSKRNKYIEQKAKVFLPTIDIKAQYPEEYGLIDFSLIDFSLISKSENE